ncbi:MAG: LLM class flavin-dependent oxidoreductase [Deltaproteobacteria bacterium]|nr:LLM class flavin-dependent oxidoreductase [Deltaproteobacteria bacterium]
MKIGMTLPVTEPGWNREVLVQWVQRIERGPFASLAAGERIAFPTPDLVALLAACAALTERVRLVTTVSVATIHDPVLLAKQWATVDMISGGRLTLGLGSGGREEDYRAVGADLRHRRMAVLAERVATMRRVWAGETVVDGLLRPVEPFPVQVGGPRLLAGAQGPRSMRSAADWADGITGMTMAASAREAAGVLDMARTAWKQAGRAEPPLLNLASWFALGEPAAARAQLRKHLRRYFNWFPDEEAEQMAESCGFAGTGVEMEAFLQALADLGTDEFVFIPTSIDPHEVDRVAEVVASFSGGATGGR